jgi:hypothetical protein
MTGEIPEAGRLPLPRFREKRGAFICCSPSNTARVGLIEDARRELEAELKGPRHAEGSRTHYRFCGNAS